MRRDLKILIGFLAAMIFLVAAADMRGTINEYPATRLVLTRDGCAYVQSIGLRTEQEQGLCVLVARYRPYVFSGGGVLFMSDNRRISVTDNLLLAYSRSDASLPQSPEQQSARRWAWGWLAIGVAFAVATFGYWLGPWGRTKGTST